MPDIWLSGADEADSADELGLGVATDEVGGIIDDGTSDLVGQLSDVSGKLQSEFDKVLKQADEYLGPGVSQELLDMVAGKNTGYAGLKSNLDTIDKLLKALQQQSSKLPSPFDSIAEVSAEFLQWLEGDFNQWLKKFMTNVLQYVPPNLVPAFEAQFDKQKYAFLGDAITSWMADLYWEGGKDAKAFVGIVKGLSLGYAKFDHQSAYQLPKRVWLMLQDAGLPKGAAGCAGEAACLSCGIGGYTSNPSFREQAADYAGISRKAPEVQYLGKLWPLVLTKYAKSLQPKEQELSKQAYFTAVKEGHKAVIDSTVGPLYNKAVGWSEKGIGDNPGVEPYVKADIGKVANLVLTFPHYALSDVQAARLEATKDGWYYFGSILLAKGGCPSNLVAQKPKKGENLKKTAKATSGVAPVVAVASGAIVVGVLV